MAGAVSWPSTARSGRRMAGLVFLLVFWVLAGACQKRSGVGGFIAPRALATSGRRSGVRTKRAARGVAGRQLWTGRRDKTAHPSIAIIYYNRMPLNFLSVRFHCLNAILALIYRSFGAYNCRRRHKRNLFDSGHRNNVFPKSRWTWSLEVLLRRGTRRFEGGGGG